MLNKEQTSQILISIYQELLAHYGPQNWWPSRSGDPWEVMLGAALVQRTSWVNVERSLDRIVAAWGLAGLADPEKLLAATEEELASLIRPSGHYNSKPRKLRNLARFVIDAGGVNSLATSQVSTLELRAALLSLWGIGPETADAILLYALGRPIFVADAYALRLVSRWGLLPPNATYNEIQTLFMDNLPHDAALFGEYHALIVEHGRQTCRHRPHCHICPLNRQLLVGVDLGREVVWQCPKNNVTQEVRG
ncbi:MAG: hypothetical protein ABIO92_09180 [Chloroflexia bacterium]